MSVQGETLYHSINHSEEQTWDGFSWPAFFFGPIWLLTKGLWGHAVIYLLAVFCTFGFGAPVVWLGYGFAGNGLHKASLLKQGYLGKGQLPTSAPPQAFSGRTINAVATTADALQQLKDLADLKERGILSDAEFAQQKAKILG